MSRSWATAFSTVLLLTLAISGCNVGGAPREVRGPTDSSDAGIDFRLEGPGGAALVVAVMINGKGPFDLILDTGATFTCLDNELVSELSLSEQRGMVGSGVGVGGSGRVRLMHVDSLRVGDAAAVDMTVCALDLTALRDVGTGARGLLGLNFLQQFHVELDFQQRQLRLTVPAA